MFNHDKADFLNRISEFAVAKIQEKALLVPKVGL